MRADYLQSIPDNPLLVFEQYEAYKRSYCNTGGDCEAQGFTFTPMVVDAHSGAWSPTARHVWDMMAKYQSATWNETGDLSSVRIAQRLAFALHRENARAVLRRTMATEEVGQASGWDEMLVEDLT
jgi:hypothetical protein